MKNDFIYTKEKYVLKFNYDVIVALAIHKINSDSDRNSLMRFRSDYYRDTGKNWR